MCWGQRVYNSTKLWADHQHWKGTELRPVVHGGRQWTNGREEGCGRWTRLPEEGDNGGFGDPG